MLSPDFRCPPLFDFSSLERPGGGVAVDVLVGDRAADRMVLGLSEGVPGLLAGLWARFPNSASSSCSDWLDVVGLGVRDAVVLGRVCACAPRSSSCARRSSGLALFFAAMFACVEAQWAESEMTTFTAASLVSYAREVCVVNVGRSIRGIVLPVRSCQEREVFNQRNACLLNF